MNLNFDNKTSLHFSSPIPNLTEISKPLAIPSGFHDIDELFDGNGYPLGRLITITSDCLGGLTTLLLISAVNFFTSF
jgi:hypothetical protein